MFVPQSFRVTVVSLALVSIVPTTRAYPIQAIQPNPSAPAPVALGASGSLATNAALLDVHGDARSRELLAGRPDAVAVRLDALGNPIAQLDLFFGDTSQLDEAALYSLLDEFDFGQDASVRKASSDTHEDARWHNVLLSPDAAGAGLPDATFFDGERDLAITIRHLENATALSCSGVFAINYNGSRATGAILDFSVVTDMISASVAPNSCPMSDPDLYLYYWNGSSWIPIASSLAASGIDSVGGFNSGCFSNTFKVRVRMYRGGSFGLRVHRYSAS